MLLLLWAVIFLTEDNGDLRKEPANDFLAHSLIVSKNFDVFQYPKNICIKTEVLGVVKLWFFFFLTKFFLGLYKHHRHDPLSTKMAASSASHRKMQLNENLILKYISQFIQSGK